MAADAFEQERKVLLGLAYRLLGSYADAEDAVQEAWVRWSSATPPDNPAAWLRTVVTRLCLDELRSARVRRESYVGPWLPEPVQTADGALGPLDNAELRDSLSLGFLLLLERLSPSERAVFVLREAFALPYDEVAAAVGKEAPACRQLHVRARAKLGQDLPAPARAGRRELLDRLLMAVATADLPGLTSLLADDAVLVSDGGGVVSAARRPITGADNVARFLIGIGTRVPEGVLMDEQEVNGAPCLVVRSGEQVTQVFAFDVDGEQVRTLQIVANPEKLSHL
ncbi:MAG: polymerase, sigma-24 subunit, subfamily [Frankiales bacterium]|nr:polymerase, sigma-24 subunit, subfamily [Frankiales bacterium]